MRKRGKVLREPSSTAGLVIVEGQQYWFSLDGLWKSEGPPQPGEVVDVDFDSDWRILAIAAVPESQLAKEQADAAAGAARKGRWEIFKTAAGKLAGVRQRVFRRRNETAPRGPSRG